MPLTAALSGDRSSRPKLKSRELDDDKLEIFLEVHVAHSHTFCILPELELKFELERTVKYIMKSDYDIPEIW